MLLVILFLTSKRNLCSNHLPLFKEGDVAFADASEDTNDVAKAIEVVNCDNQQIVSGFTHNTWT